MDPVRFCTLAAVVVAAYFFRNDLPPFHLTDAIGLGCIGLLLLWMFRKRSVRGEDSTDS
jgi:hypothetical protein